MIDYLLSMLHLHGAEAVIILVLGCYNVLGTAIVSVLQKVEAAYSPGNQSIDGIIAFIGKTAGWAASIGDWLLGNKPH